MSAEEDIKALQKELREACGACNVELKDLEKRVRVNEDYRSSHEAQVQAWWAEQRRWNKVVDNRDSNSRDNIRVLYKKLTFVPTENDMLKLEQKIDTTGTTCQEILKELSSNKGRDGVIQVIVTAVITLALAGLGFVLFK